MSRLFSMARFQDLNDQMENLNLEEEENTAFVLEGDVEEALNKYELCLVGRFLTEKNINVRAMKSKLADIWKPAMGISIKELETGIFLFQFYHKEDMLWVSNGGPWQFDNAMLCINIVPNGEDPLNVPLWYLNIWLQIHDLPSGLMTEPVGKQLGDFFGEFLEYDLKNNTSIWRESMRIKVRLDVRKPLKRRKKITRRNGVDVIVSCKYERLGDFCFACGFVTHTERFCRKLLDKTIGEASREWGTWLRAMPRRASGQTKSKWLRDEGDADWEKQIGRGNRIPQSGESGYESGDILALQKGGGRFRVHENRAFANQEDLNLKKAALAGGGTNLKYLIGPEDEE